MGKEPEPPAPKRQPEEPPAKSRAVLLDPAEAWAECKRRVANVLPDLPAFGLVVIFGCMGALLGWCWHLQITLAEGKTLDVQTLKLPLALGLGVSGAVAAVFLLAKTDTSKLIHCSLVALFSGMVGPALVMKALTAVADIKPGAAIPVELLQVKAEASSAGNSSKQLQGSFAKISSGNGSASEATQQVSKTTLSATSSIASLQELKTNNPEAASAAAASIEGPLKETVANLGSVAPQSEDAILGVRAIMSAAEKAGLTGVVQKAEEVISANASNPLVRKVLDRLAAPTVCFITPPELTDDLLQQTKAQIQELYPDWSIKGTVHPQGSLENGIEVVYYNQSNTSDVQNRAAADRLLDYLKKYFGVTTGKVRAGTLPNGERRAQLDLHVGPDAAANFLRRVSSPSPVPSPPAPSPQAPPGATPTPASTPLPATPPHSRNRRGQ